MTIAIVYNGGAYGTYLEWVLTTLTTNIPIVAPFRPNGSSHQFHGNHAGDLYSDKWKAVVNKKNQFYLFAFTQKHDNMKC